MSPNGPRVIVPGSERAALPGAQAVGTPDPNERISVTVLLRHRPAAAPPGGADAGTDTQMNAPADPNANDALAPLTREQYAEQFGSSPDDIALVEAFAHNHQLDVVSLSAARRSITLSGTVTALSAAFGVELGLFAHPEGTFRGRTGGVTIPADLAGIVEGVFGLDNRPQARPQYQIEAHRQHRPHPHPHPHPTPTPGPTPQPAPAPLPDPSAPVAFTPPQVAQLYNFPPGLTGKGQCIALIELNTPKDQFSQPGSGYRVSDLNAYFAKLNLPSPNITAISVDGGHNLPLLNPDADGEVMLDIEVAAGVAPDALIAVYFAPNTDQGFLDALTTAIHDTQHAPSVVSISWGGTESRWTAQALQAFNGAMQDAARLGVTVCCASGDSGSFDQRPGQPDFDGKAHADFPASSPFALACGGTRLIVQNNALVGEAVWNSLDRQPPGATGGGISDVFAVPDYQAGVALPASANGDGRRGRGVPDVSGDADPATGYLVQVDGQTLQGVGGTSAVAPLWAGLIVLLNQSLGHSVGFLNPRLYSGLAAQGGTRDITEGNNGAYQAGSGWDACTGWGSPNGARLLQLLTTPPVQTP